MTTVDWTFGHSTRATPVLSAPWVWPKTLDFWSKSSSAAPIRRAMDWTFGHFNESCRTISHLVTN